MIFEDCLFYRTLIFFFIKKIRRCFVMNNLLILYRINAAISAFFLNENSLIDNESSVVNRKLYQMNFRFKPKVNFGITKL